MSARSCAIGMATGLLGACVFPEEDRPAQRVQRLGSQCGEERWSVKTGTDQDASSVNLTPQDVLISDLIAFPRPAVLPHQRRVGVHERQVYRLTRVTLVKYKRETDGDFHLVLSDGTQTMIAEIPAVDCVGGGPFIASIRRVRDRFESRYIPEERFLYLRVPISIQGVGFFDFLHDQTGVAPNGFELHPVLDLCFGSNCRLTSGDPTGTADTPTPPSPLGCGCATGDGPTVALVLLLVLGWFRRGRTGESLPGRRTAE
jgi:MYXO-CTERM domain-containing protein